MTVLAREAGDRQREDLRSRDSTSVATLLRYAQLQRGIQIPDTPMCSVPECRRARAKFGAKRAGDGERSVRSEEWGEEQRLVEDAEASKRTRTRTLCKQRAEVTFYHSTCGGQQRVYIYSWLDSLVAQTGDQFV